MANQAGGAAGHADRMPIIAPRTPPLTERQRVAHSQFFCCECHYEHLSDDDFIEVERTFLRGTKRKFRQVWLCKQCYDEIFKEEETSEPVPLREQFWVTGEGMAPKRRRTD